MKTVDRNYISTLLADSIRLEADHEPAQAFDKLARAVESFLPFDFEESQAQKASNLFNSAMSEESIWRVIVEHSFTLASVSRELAYYVVLENKEAADRLFALGKEFEKSVNRGDRSVAAQLFSRWFLLIRNKRFHGDSAFQGRNFRFAMKMKDFLRLLRIQVEYFLTKSD